MNIVGKKKLYFLLSGIIIIPGLISLFLWGLNFGIDFKGGSRIELSLPKGEQQDFKKFVATFNSNGAEVHDVRISDKDTVVVRTAPIDQKTNVKIITELKKQNNKISEVSFDTVGPTIGKETTGNAIKAVIIASILITLYIAYAFREVSRPVASWKFGVAAIVALLHDVLIVLGIFSILGHFLRVEVDSLFITALLTVMGFSVHDTIVVFDRIRENLKKHVNVSFDQNVNNSILETFNRSLNTSLTVLIVLFSLLLFSGDVLRWFIVALLIGITAGTYSSIFNAAPLLVAWYEWDKKRRKK